MNRILIATGNKHKREKLTWIVKDFFSRIDFPENLPCKITVEEKGKTFEENAAIKAVDFSKHYEGFTIATDGGVLIPALGGKWDELRTKRFVGEETTDFQRIEALLDLMKDKKGKERETVWNEAIALAKGGKLLFLHQAEGVVGVLQDYFDPEKYREGIWVCSVWYFPQFGKNFFDLTEEETKEVENSWEILMQHTQKFLKEYFK